MLLLLSTNSAVGRVMRALLATRMSVISVSSASVESSSATCLSARVALSVETRVSRSAALSLVSISALTST